MKQRLMLQVAGFILLSFTTGSVFDFAHADTYRITYRNKTPQGLTSPVCMIHKKKASMFKMGEAASSGLAQLAEDGVTGEFVNELRAMKGVRVVETGSFTSANGRSSFTISTNKRGRLSCVFGMLVATNDAFPALLRARLPRGKRTKRRFRANVYDAGSEVNTESCDHVPGGICDAHFIGEAENGTVQRHPGIQGLADLSVEQYGWEEPGVRGQILKER